MAEFKYDVRWEWNSTVTVYADSAEEAEAKAVIAAQEQFGEEMEGSAPSQDDVEVYPA